MADISQIEVWLTNEWTIVTGASFLFTASVLALFLLGWLAVHFVSRERLKTQNERFNFH